MKIAAMGIGKYGMSMLEHLCYDGRISRRIALDQDKGELELANANIKIKIAKRLSPIDAVSRVERKIQCSCKDIDLLLMIINPADMANPDILPEIYECIDRIGVVVVGVVIEPCGKFERKRKNAIERAVNYCVNTFATVVIPQKCISRYNKKFTPEWIEYYTSWYENRKTVQECCAFQTWLSSKFENVNNSSLEMQVGLFNLERILKGATTKYAYNEEQNILDILDIPGYIHLASVAASGKSRKEVIKWRATYNDILLTNNFAAQGMLLSLTLPEDISKEEASFICVGIYGYGSETVNFNFNMNTTETDVVYADIIATGTYQTEEDIYKIFGVTRRK